MTQKISSREDLLRLKEKFQAETELRGEPKEIQITVHMGTCGIAAGARDILNQLTELLLQMGIHNQHEGAVGWEAPVDAGVSIFGDLGQYVGYLTSFQIPSLDSAWNFHFQTDIQTLTAIAGEEIDMPAIHLPMYICHFAAIDAHVRDQQLFQSSFQVS